MKLNEPNILERGRSINPVVTRPKVRIPSHVVSFIPNIDKFHSNPGVNNDSTAPGNHDKECRKVVVDVVKDASDEVIKIGAVSAKGRKDESGKDTLHPHARDNLDNEEATSVD